MVHGKSLKSLNGLNSPLRWFLLRVAKSYWAKCELETALPNTSSCSAPKGHIARGWSAIFLHNSHETSLVYKTQGMCGAIRGEKKVLLWSHPWGKQKCNFRWKTVMGMIGSWFIQLINPTLHVHSGLVNLNSHESHSWRRYKSKQICHTPRPVCSHYNISQVICLATTANATCLTQKYTVVATTSCFFKPGTQMNCVVWSELPT